MMGDFLCLILASYYRCKLSKHAMKLKLSCLHQAMNLPIQTVFGYHGSYKSCQGAGWVRGGAAMAMTKYWSILTKIQKFNEMGKILVN